MGAVRKSRLKAVEAPKPQTIAQALDAVAAQKSELSGFDLEYLVRLQREEDAATAKVNEAVANLNMARGARIAFGEYIRKSYSLTNDEDKVDLDTGTITRAPNTE